MSNEPQYGPGTHLLGLIVIVAILTATVMVVIKGCGAVL